MRYRHVWVGLISLLSTAALANPIQMDVLSEAKRVDMGGETTHRVRLTNGSTHPVVLEKLNAHRFIAPRFKDLCRMKSPGSHWTRWQNVLMPQQSVVIPVFAGRVRPGEHALELSLSYRLMETKGPWDWAQRCVPLQDKRPGPTVGVCDRLGPIPANAHVAYSDKLPPKMTRRTSKQSWPYRVQIHERVAQLTHRDRVVDFIPDVPYLGLVVWFGGGPVPTAHTTKGKTTVPLGAMTNRAASVLGAALQANRPIKIRAQIPTIFAGSGLTVQQEEKEHVATARVSPYDLVAVWNTVTIPARGLRQLKKLLSNPKVCLFQDPVYGLILEHQPTPPPPDHS